MASQKKKKKTWRRGYYSEVATDLDITTENLSEFEAAFKRPKLLWQVITERHAPVTSDLTTPIKPNFLAPAERWMTYENEKDIVRSIWRNCLFNFIGVYI